MFLRMINIRQNDKTILYIDFNLLSNIEAIVLSWSKMFWRQFNIE